jgi:hypothetical protein
MTTHRAARIHGLRTPSTDQVWAGTRAIHPGRRKRAPPWRDGAVPVEVFLGVLPSGRAQPGGEAGIIEQPENRRRERRLILFRNQQAGLLVLDDIHDAADRRGHDRLRIASASMRTTPSPSVSPRSSKMAGSTYTSQSR